MFTFLYLDVSFLTCLYDQAKMRGTVIQGGYLESRFKRAGKLSQVVEFDSLFSFLKRLKYKKHLGAVIGTIWGQEPCWGNVMVQL